MNIGEAARRSGLPPKTIRYYEDIGLVRPARADNGYRSYCERDVHVLRFLQRSLSLGFSTEDSRRLLSLYGNAAREADEVRQLAGRRMSEIDRKIAELQSLKRALGVLIEDCQRGAGPDCPILEEIAGEGIRVARSASG